MNYTFNEDIKSLQPSASIAFMEKARELKAQGFDVISLAGGEPDFDTPVAATYAGIKGLVDGHTHYTAGKGLSALRKRIAHKLVSENGIQCSMDNILVTPGGKSAIYVAVRSLINPGDEVMILDPSWVSYDPIVRASSGVPVHIALSFDDGYQITKEKLESSFSKRTRVLIVNSPNNPTGRVLTKDEVDTIAKFSMKHDLMVISDEIYEKIVFDGRKNISLASLPEIRERVITVNGFSKSAAMTGWRLGYLAAEKAVVDTIYLLYQHVLTCIGEFVQEAGLIALDCDAEMEEMKLSYESRRDIFVEKLNAITGVHCLVPEGAFYAWVRINHRGMNDCELANLLLEQAHVVVVPGSSYGKGGENCVRMCFASSLHDLLEAAQRIGKVFHH